MTKEFVFKDNITLDLNGKTITNNNYGVVWRGDGLTIKNGTFVAKDTEAEENGGVGSYAIFIWGVKDGTKQDANTAKYVATVDGVTKEGGINVSSHKVIIKNSAVKRTNYYALSAKNLGSIEVQSGNFKKGNGGGAWAGSEGEGDTTGKISVIGGKFDFAPETYVNQENYTITKDVSTETWTVTTGTAK